MPWQTKVDLSDLFVAFDENSMTVEEIARATAARLRKNRYASDLHGVIELLEEVDDIDDYDSLLATVYDFGDINKRIWIETYTRLTPHHDQTA